MKISLIVAIVFLAVFLGGRVQAQQSAMYSQYMFNTLAVNPAYAGSRNVISATALLRNQWTGIVGAPRTSTLTIDAPLKDRHIGVGLQIFNDKLGITNSTGAVFSYAYRIRMEKATLSFGMQGSINQFTANYAGIALDPGSEIYDPAFNNDVRKALFNVGTGIYYNSDKYYIGLSSPELLSNKLASDSTNLTKKFFHIYLASGYVFDINNDFKFKPSFLFKAVKGSPLQADLNATIWIKDRLAVGAQYRTSADILGLLELQINPQIKIGYAYDHSTTKLRKFNSGSHEIMLRYEFGFSAGKVLSPRYF